MYSVLLAWISIKKLNENVENIIEQKYSSGFKNFEKIYQINKVIRNRIDLKNLSTIYIVTPTYARPTQQAEMTRLMNTLRNVPRIIWVVVEDSHLKSHNLRNFLHNSGLTYVLLNVKSKQIDLKKYKQHNLKPGERFRMHRGTDQRNLAIEYVKRNSKNDNDIVYFADDDNAYSISLFEEVCINIYLNQSILNNI